MEVTRITFRIPKYLDLKVKLLASQNNLSMNNQLIELIEFGIKYLLEKDSDIEKALKRNN